MRVLSVLLAAALAACGGGDPEPEFIGPPERQNLPMVRLKGFPGMLLVQGCYDHLTPEGECLTINTYGAPIKPGAFCKVPLDPFDDSCPIEEFVFELAPVTITPPPPPKPEL